MQHRITRANLSRRTAFSLVEVAVTIGILSVIFATAFALLGGATRDSGELEARAELGQAINHFRDYVNQSDFATLYDHVRKNQAEFFVYQYRASLPRGSEPFTEAAGTLGSDYRIKAGVRHRDDSLLGGELSAVDRVLYKVLLTRPEVENSAAPLPPEPEDFEEAHLELQAQFQVVLNHDAPTLSSTRTITMVPIAILR